VYSQGSQSSSSSHISWLYGTQRHSKDKPLLLENLICRC